MSNVNQNEMLVGLDIGTSKVVVVVAEVTSDNSIEIIGLGIHPSKGLRNGVVVDIDSTTTAIKKFDKMRDWKLIVIGDLKTPKNYKLKNGIYLSPKDQERLDKKLSNLIGWICIQRRNMGLIVARKRSAHIIALIDDDNIPYKTVDNNNAIG